MFPILSFSVFRAQLCILGSILYIGHKCVFRAQMCISGLYYFWAARLKHGTFSEIRAGLWAEGSARGPARHDPNLILGRAGPKLNVSSFFGLGPGWARRPECTPIPPHSADRWDLLRPLLVALCVATLRPIASHHVG
jgi:hypothetical protein